MTPSMRDFAERMLATLHEDVEQIEQLERLAHHVAMFAQMIAEWRTMPHYD